MNLWPLCTAKVSATISGVIVERRDQVRMICFSPEARAASIFFFRWSSRNGPFFSDLAILFSLAAFAPRPAAYDVTIRGLLAPGLVSLRRHPPRRLRMIAFGTPFAAAVRMVHRVHRDPAHVRAPSQMAVAAGFADR